MQVGKTGGEEGEGRGGIAINLAAPYDGDEMMARFKRYEFFVFF